MITAKDDRFRLIHADIYDVHFDKRNDLFDVGWFDSWTSQDVSRITSLIR